MTPFVQDADFTLYVGDVRDCLRGLPAGSVHTVVTSPPYWSLRDYNTPGQLGLEPTPEQYVAVMVDVFREVRRVLRDDGTLWLNLGDSYASSPPGNVAGVGATSGLHGANDASGTYRETLKAGHATKRNTVVGGLKPKDLVGIPWRVAFALQADGWYLRSDIIWSKPNPMPESVTDRPTKAHEYVFLLTKSPRYFFDQEAVREPHATPLHAPGNKFNAAKVAGPMDRGGKSQWERDMSETWGSPNGRNVRSVWELATQAFPEAHFATFPEALPERCIKAGTSERGCCPECGAPFDRVTERQNESTYAQIKREHGITYKDMKAEAAANGITPGNVGGTHAPGQRGANLPPSEYKTVGWATTCNHDLPPVPCTVLDPFMGSGTTALVARRLGRRSIGVELNPEYAALCARRLQQLSLEFA